MDSRLYDPVRTMASVTQEVIVGFSGGKDSCVTLDLCSRFFKKVYVYFMYQVPGLSFQEKTLSVYEKRYKIEILRIPHFETSVFLRYGTYRESDFTVPIISVTDEYNWLRNRSGIYWIAAGERAADSIVRGAMIKHSGSIDAKRGRFFPLAWWTKNDVMEYIRVKKLYLGEESRVLGHSFRSLDGKSLAVLKEKYPADYEKVRRIYPLCDGAVMREVEYGSH